MARVYSAVLTDGIMVAPATISTAVPADQTWVLRDISVALANSTATVGLFAVLVNATEVAAWTFPPGFEETQHWEGRVVVPGGSTLLLALAGAGPIATPHVSGYKLTP